MKLKASTQILLAMIAGILLGLLLGHLNTAPQYEDTTYAKIADSLLAKLDFVGRLFMRLLMMIIIPLIRPLAETVSHVPHSVGIDLTHLPDKNLVQTISTIPGTSWVGDLRRFCTALSAKLGIKFF